MIPGRYLITSLDLIFFLVSGTPEAAYSDRVKILYKNPESIQIRADLIRQARSELNIAYFYVQDDIASISGFSLLLDAADRGVQVRVILDGLFQGISLPFIKALVSHPTIELREYNRFSIFHLLRTFKRSHEKIHIADNIHTKGFHYITGGRNVADSYFGFGTGRIFDDLDIYVYGESAGIARQLYFNRLWESDLVREISLGLYSLKNFENIVCLQAKREDDYCTRSLALRMAAYDAARIEILNSRNMMISGQVPGLNWNSEVRWDKIARDVGQVRFLYDEPGAAKHEDGIAAELYEIIVSDTTIREITILSPYVILTARGFELIRRLSERRVKITLITNSLNSTDNILAQAGYANNKKWLLDRGLNIYHYTGPNTMHAKALIINDGESLLIGTYNFDPRSARLNREIGVQIRGIENSVVLDSLRQMLDYFISGSLNIGTDGIPAGFDKEHPNASFTKKLLMGLFQPVVALPPIKKNL